MNSLVLRLLILIVLHCQDVCLAIQAPQNQQYPPGSSSGGFDRKSQSYAKSYSRPKKPHHYDKNVTQLIKNKSRIINLSIRDEESRFKDDHPTTEPIDNTTLPLVSEKISKDQFTDEYSSTEPVNNATLSSVSENAETSQSHVIITNKNSDTIKSINSLKSKAINFSEDIESTGTPLETITESEDPNNIQRAVVAMENSNNQIEHLINRTDGLSQLLEQHSILFHDMEAKQITLQEMHHQIQNEIKNRNREENDLKSRMIQLSNQLEEKVNQLQSNSNQMSKRFQLLVSSHLKLKKRIELIQMNLTSQINELNDNFNAKIIQMDELMTHLTSKISNLQMNSAGYSHQNETIGAEISQPIDMGMNITDPTTKKLLPPITLPTNRISKYFQNFFFYKKDEKSSHNKKKILHDKNVRGGEMVEFEQERTHDAVEKYGASIYQDELMELHNELLSSTAQHRNQIDFHRLTINQLEGRCQELTHRLDECKLNEAALESKLENAMKKFHFDNLTTTSVMQKAQNRLGNLNNDEKYSRVIEHWKGLNSDLNYQLEVLKATVVKKDLLINSLQHNMTTLTLQHTSNLTLPISESNHTTESSKSPRKKCFFGIL